MKPDRNGHYCAEDWKTTNPGYQYTQPRHHKMLCADGVVRKCVDVDGGVWFDVVQQQRQAEKPKTKPKPKPRATRIRK